MKLFSALIWIIWVDNEKFNCISIIYLICYTTIIRSSNIFFNCNRDMHKSALTFGLLASSLVMLAIVPFLNHSNSFSNLVMAQEYHKYGDIYYGQYPTDDKKY